MRDLPFPLSEPSHALSLSHPRGLATSLRFPLPSPPRSLAWTFALVGPMCIPRQKVVRLLTCRPLMYCVQPSLPPLYTPSFPPLPLSLHGILQNEWQVVGPLLPLHRP
jgi:hypothetical protein